MDFIEVLKGRHSAVNFEAGFEMRDRDFDNLFKLTKQAPSPYNLQTTKYIVVRDPVIKDAVYELCYRQFKIHTATAVIIVAGDKSSISVETGKEVYLPSRNLGMINEDDYDTILNQIAGFSESLKDNPVAMEKELLQTAALSTGFLVLSAKYLGFDTCIMHIQQEVKMRELLKMPDNIVPTLMVAIGKSVDRKRPRGYRRGFDDLVSYDKAGARW